MWLGQGWGPGWISVVHGISGHFSHGRVQPGVQGKQWQIKDSQQEKDRCCWEGEP